MSSKKDPQENQTQIHLGEDPTIFENSNAQPSETLQNPGDLLEVPASLLGELTSDQTVDYSPANSTDPRDPNCQTIGATPGSENDDNQEPNTATCDFTPQNESNPDGTAVLPKGWTSKKSSQDDFSMAPSPVLDTRLHSRSDSKASQARIPKQIGSYTIEKVLGRGGMGIVYKAYQTKLGRPVALKMILGGAHVSEQVMSRFTAEAKAVAHLQHPNIVQIFEVGEHDGLPFFSLEYVNGPPLDKKLDGKPIAPDDAARWLIDICTAMQYAHDNGVLHRDLKPANVLSTKDGILKVSDFGLAKRLEDNSDSSSTREGTIMGTPNYMSPEQARGAIHELGPATDQYSLGAMLYEFLTGRPPFMAPKPLETIMQVINSEPIPPRQLQPKLPIDIETICMKALQKDPTKRYASCQELASDLK
ncbi:MAG: serine/threonine protein kinase, partial [Pirellula sp.]